MKKRDGATKKYDKKVNIKFFYVVPECDVVAWIVSKFFTESDFHFRSSAILSEVNSIQSMKSVSARIVPNLGGCTYLPLNFVCEKRPFFLRENFTWDQSSKERDHALFKSDIVSYFFWSQLRNLFWEASQKQNCTPGRSLNQILEKKEKKRIIFCFFLSFLLSFFFAYQFTWFGSDQTS